MDEQTPIGLLLSDDLIFTSRITGAAAKQQLTLKTARTVEKLQALVLEHSPRGVIVDLENPNFDAAELLGWLKTHCAEPPRVVAYGAHVEAALLRAAREAGCAEVHPRSKFVEVLPMRIAEWLR
jgi:DNA-binding NarL/FixJ family response regulator